MLTPEALDFIAGLHRAFNGRRLELLQQRVVRQAAIDAGALRGFLPETRRPGARGHRGARRHLGRPPRPVPVAMAVFDRVMPQANQVDRQRPEVEMSAAHLLEVHQDERTEAGVRDCIRDGVRYIQAWLRGRGAVPL